MNRTWATLGALLTLTVATVFGSRAWLHSYLYGPDFHRFVEARLGETLRAEVECAPFTFDGLTLHCDKISARGYDDATFSEASLSRVWARFELATAFSRAWKIQRIGAESGEVQFHGSRLVRPQVAADPAHPRAGSSNRLVPSRLEIEAGDFHDVNLLWAPDRMGAGSLRHADVLVTPLGTSAKGWKFDVSLGTLSAEGFPSLDVASASLSFRRSESILTIDEASFVSPGGGSATARGEVRFGRNLDIRTHVSGVELAPLLSGDWRLRLHGRMIGDVRIQSPLPATGPPNVGGTMQLVDGRIEALPILTQIAAVTRAPQLRQLSLSRCQGEFTYEDGQLVIGHLVAEHERRLRVEGDLTLAAGQVDGRFQIGVPPGAVQWIPGASEHIFNTARQGLVWAPMHLSGPVDSPTEDLSSRLLTVAGETVIDQLDQTAGDLIDKARAAARGALEGLLPLLK